MSKGLEKIVASLELCKLIPAGEFEDTALIHVLSPHGPCVMERPYGTQCEYYPAPTLEEIIADLPSEYEDGSLSLGCNYIEYAGVEFAVDDTTFSSEEEGGFAAAALQLWLKMKGIESK